jgi:hypothetical protein
MIHIVTLWKNQYPPDSQSRRKFNNQKQAPNTTNKKNTSYCPIKRKEMIHAPLVASNNKNIRVELLSI